TSVRAYEQEVIRLVNVERAKAGLKALTEDWELSRVARYKSQDMHDLRYFSHTSPTYGSPFDMMKAFGIRYRTAGENIAMGYRTPAAVVQGWMNSPGHRANILNASYTKIGVGYVASGNYWTQHFIG
ncbi:MAG: secretion protein, partial [Oscillospiraceae bacterium]|nr:secretion protein [Oscillospiraceae bacterium]